jgi:putative acetyltransferase
VTAGDGALTAEVRVARDSDLEGIYEAHVRAIREVCVSAYGQREVAAWSGRLYPGIHAPVLYAHAFYVVVAEGTVAGFGQLEVESGEVHGIYVHPAFLRRGFGTRLLAALESRARDARVPTLTLRASLNAVSFYHAAGFTSEGDDLHPVDDTVSIACVRMAKRL